jgi:SAM-dependent methyltransferase
MATYSSLKKIILSLIPGSVLIRFEYPLRYLYSLRFLGTTCQCNLCNTGLKAFIPLENDLLCPRCGSLQRTRRLFHLLENQYLDKKLSILDFSPSRSLYRKLKKSSSSYLSSDFSGEFIADVSFDITQIPVKEEQYDLILCYHILEHIPEDQKAMSELFRVLKKGGKCLIQTPFREGEIYEDPAIQSPEERTKHFGQSDHLRVYSKEGLADRLRKAGFEVSILNFKEEKNNPNGFQETESVLIAHRVD